MASSNIRLFFLTVLLACLVGLYWYQLGRNWSANRFADEAFRQGAVIEGTYLPETAFERTMERATGLQYPSRFDRIDRIDMLAVRDIDAFMVHLDAALDASVIKLGPGVRSPQSLEALGRLRNLTHLIIVAPQADDLWLKGACRTPSLRRVSIRGGRITDEGIRMLAGARTLRIVRIPDSAVTDAGVAALAGSIELEELDLRGAGITDASVPVLNSLPNLKDLNIVRTQITRTGAESLRAAGTRRVLH
jgi:hypothetical protein